MALNDSVNYFLFLRSQEKDEEKLSPENLSLSEEFLNWLSAIKHYVEETGESSLDLKSRGLSANETKVILESLENSQVDDLDLTGNDLKNGIKIISEALVRSKIKKLSLIYCNMLNTDLIGLMKILNNTMITNLDISNNNVKSLTDEEGQIVISHLLKSHIKTIRLGSNYIFDENDRAAKLLAEGLPSSSITSLDLEYSALSCSRLLSKLPQTSLTELNLCSKGITISDLKVLAENLKDSKLEKLDLSENDISDAGINILVLGLRDSKVVDLNLFNNEFSGSNNLGHYLKDTKIRTLGIDSNSIKQRRMFSFPDFLKGTAVVSLDISHCNLGDELGQEVIRSLKSTMVTELNIGGNNLGPSSISEFANNIRDLNLVNFDFSSNKFSSEMFVILGECLEESKLKDIDVNACCKPNNAVGLFYFLKCTKNTSVVSVKIALNKLGASGGELLAKALRGTSLTHLDASYNDLGSSVSSLAAHLRSTSITHLNLMKNKIADDSAEVLAECLKDSRVVELDLSDNFISSQGAKALAFCLKKSSLLCLKLNGNKIERDGYEALARHAESSFITTLRVHLFNSPANRLLFIDTVLWKNRAAVHKLVSLFKNIAPKIVDESSCFNLCKGDENVMHFLEDCLVFYKTALKNQSSAATALAQEESLPLSKEQIVKFLTDFPGQLALFMVKEIEADVAHQVDILEKAEELGLTNIVELLLLNRPVYVIDQGQNILHPRVYMLLHKYKQPVCNVGVEPQGRERIIKYFREHSDLEGASDVIALLQDAKLF